MPGLPPWRLNPTFVTCPLPAIAAVILILGHVKLTG
jgi:hypothetical protein